MRSCTPAPGSPHPAALPAFTAMNETHPTSSGTRIATPLKEPPSPERIRELFPGEPYVGYQAPRFAMVLAMLGQYVGKETRILDVGRTMLTGMIEALYDRPVDSLGFEPDASLDHGAHHFQFDLNDAQNRAKWRTDLPGYDIVLMAEVIEHLHTAPSLVLGFLQSLLRPGGVLIVQTPNALAIGRRLSMVFGHHPFELIRENPTNPGHFREYTIAELQRYGRQLGMTVLSALHTHTIDLRYKFALLRQPTEGREVATSRTIVHRLHEIGLTNFIYRHLPGSLRPGLTVVFQKPPHALVQ